MFVASPALAAMSYFDVVSELEVVAGPPYPTTCHRTDVAHENSGVFERDGQLALGVRRAIDSEGNHIATDLRPFGEHAPGEDFGDHKHFEVLYCADPDGPGFPPESTIALLMELTAFGGRPGKLVTLHPELHVTDPGRFFEVSEGPSSVDIVCQVVFGRGILHELTLQADLPDEMLLTGARLTVREQSLESVPRSDPLEMDSYFSAAPDAFFDLRLSVGCVAYVEDHAPVVSLTFSGRFMGGTSPVEDTTWGAIKALYGN